MFLTDRARELVPSMEKSREGVFQISIASGEAVMARPSFSPSCGVLRLDCVRPDGLA